MIRAAGASLLIAALCFGCRSTAPLQPLGTTDAAAAWDELLRIAAASEVVESYSKLTLVAPRRQTIHARTAVDRQGRFNAELLTPLGTTAATLFADGGNVLFLNDLERTYWRGTHTQLAASSPRIAPLFAIGQRTSRLIYGLPLPADAVDECSADDRALKCYEGGAGSYLVESGGLRSATANGASFVYEPAAFPPRRVIVSLQGESISIEHIDIQSRPGAIKVPAVPAGYRCCSAPSLEVKER